MDEPSRRLIEEFRSGDQRAADEIFRRYVSRLTVFARSRLSPRIRRRIDPEDVVLSAYRSFFLRARDGKLSLRRSGDLWRLLVAITLNKVRHQAARHRAKKRSVDREQSLEERDPPVDAKQQPSPLEGLIVAEELERVMGQLAPLKRQVLELRLVDEPIARIALKTGRCERTVRRMLADLQKLLEQRLLQTRENSS
ncbi:MAG TPA: ECF-type sigma factor [Pirellulales bacterium]